MRTEPLTLAESEARKAEYDNSVPGDLTGYDCPECLNRGRIYFVNEQGFESSRRCKCMDIRASLKRMERSGLMDAIKRYSFETWQTPERWQAKALELAQRYAQEKEGWFLAMGQTGSGKSHLCTAICGELLAQGVDTMYMLWRDVSVKAKACVNDAEEYAKLVGPLKKVRCLYIDDLFKSGNRPTAGDINLAFELLNDRYIDTKKLTIISTEYSLDQLEEMDEAISGRIYERSKGYRLDFSGKPNWRMKERHGHGRN